MKGERGKDSAVIQAVVTKEMKARLKEVAAKEGRTESNWVRFHISRLLEQHGAKG